MSGPGPRLNRRHWLAALLAASSLPWPLALRAQGFDRPPPAGPALPLLPPPLGETVLPNGLRVLVAQRRGVPLVSVRLLLTEAGSLGDAEGKAGLARLHLLVLSRGVLRDGEPNSADDIAFAAESLGAALEVETLAEAGSLGLTVARPALEEALDLLGDLLLQPMLAPDEVERGREELLDARRQQLDDAAQLAPLLARRLHWGPGAAGLLPGAASLARLTRRDLLEQQRRLRPDACVLVLAGDIDLEEARSLALLQFGEWRPPAQPLPERRRLQPVELPPRTLIVDRPGAAQASIALAAPFPGAAALGAEARLALSVLGQGYSSRLNQQLRIRRGLAYGVSCEADSAGGAGLLLSTTQTRPALAAEAIALMGAEWLRLAEDEIGAAELDARRAALLGSHGRALETTATLAGLLVEQALSGRPLAELQRLAEALEQVTPTQLHSWLQAQRWQDEELRRVVVADLAAAGPALRQLDPAAWIVPHARLDPASPTLRSR